MTVFVFLPAINIVRRSAERLIPFKFALSVTVTAFTTASVLESMIVMTPGVEPKFET